MRLAAPALLLVAACTASGSGDAGGGGHASEHRAEADAAVWPGLEAGPGDDPLGGQYSFPCLQPSEPTGGDDYESIFREIFCKRGCTVPYCHGSRTHSGGLSFETMEIGYAGLVGQPTSAQIPSDGAAGCNDSELLRVSPGKPEQSLAYLKLASRPPCGSPMPPPNSDLEGLSEAELERVRGWIARGAPRTP